MHAHVTLLSPWLGSPTAEDLATVEKIAASVAAFSFVLADLDVFPGGTIHLPPLPAEPFAALSAELCAAFPMCPPYGGEYDVAPHLTLDQLLGGVSVASTRAALGTLVPVTCRAERIDLQWYDNHDCRLVASWPLGGAA